MELVRASRRPSVLTQHLHVSNFNDGRNLWKKILPFMAWPRCEKIRRRIQKEYNFYEPVHYIHQASEQQVSHKVYEIQQSLMPSSRLESVQHQVLLFYSYLPCLKKTVSVAHTNLNYAEMELWETHISSECKCRSTTVRFRLPPLNCQ